MNFKGQGYTLDSIFISDCQECSPAPYVSSFFDRSWGYFGS